MKGDFSRLGPWPDEQTTGVWLQQGRPLLDADWNALQATLRGMVAGAMDAMLGGPAAPRDDAGFEVTVRGSLPLNQDSQGARQSVWLAPSRSLPFRERDEPLDEAENGETDGGDQPDSELLEALTPEFHEDHHRPYILELELWLQPDASGVLIDQPGAVALTLLPDGELRLGLSDERPVKVAGGPLGPGRVGLTLLQSGGRYVLYRDGLRVAEWRGKPHRERFAHGHALSLAGPAHETDGGFVACNLDHMKLWAARRHGREPNRHRFNLVADLDFRQVSGGRVHDRSRHRNDGRLSSTGAMPVPSTRFWLGAGRYFVDGTRIVNPRPVALEETGSGAESDGAQLVYLEVWEQTVSALEDPDLREVALGGPDTVVHSRNAWRPRLVRGDDADAALSAFRALESRPAARASFQYARAAMENALYRVEIQHPGWAYAWPPGPRARQAVLPARRSEAGGLTLPNNGLTPAVGAPLLAFAETGGPWVVRVTAGGSAQELSVSGGPVDWPDGAIGLLPLAAFKWSADNAAEAWRVESLAPVDGATGDPVVRVQLADDGFNGVDIAVGDWLDLRPASAAAGDEPGRLYPVAAFDRGLLHVDLERWDGALRADQDLILRRWGPPVQDSPVSADYPAVVAEALTQLDDNVAVGFDAEGYYSSGEWWAFALRENPDAPWSDGEVRTPMEPARGGIRRVPVAMVDRRRDGARVTDLRRLFVDLPTLTKGERPPDPRPDPEPPRPHPHPHPEPREPTVEEVARWLGRHAPGVRLLSAAPPPPGFRVTGETLTVRCLEAARWEAVPSTVEAPRGPGHAVCVDDRLVFLEDGGAGVWSWSPGGTWSRLSPRPTPRRGFAVAVSGSDIVIVGGAHGADNDLIEHIEILSADGSWSRLEHARIGVFQPAATVIGATLYLTGGRDRRGGVTRRGDAVDLYNGEVRDLPHMHDGRADHVMVACDGALWIFGGVDHDGRPTRDAEAFDLIQERWRSISEMPRPGRGLSAAVMEDGIVLAGGDGGLDGYHAAVRLYRPQQDSWSELPPLREPTARAGLATVVTPDGASALYLIGGQGETGAERTFETLRIRRTLNLLAGSEDR